MAQKFRISSITPSRLAMALCSAAFALPPAQAAAEGRPAPAAAPARSGSQLNEIVVTATRTGETKAQSTPLALSVFSPADLERTGANNVKDLVSMTPNLKVSQVTASAAIYIRGIGSNNIFAGSDPDVTVQSDGVYIARAFGQFMDFNDIERLEVLRGPQGTLYGRNAIGGTINIISRKPSDDFTGKVALTAGSFNLLQAQGYVSGPLIPGKLQASIAGNYINHDDYIDNLVPGQPGIGNADHGGTRGQLRFVPSETVEVILRGDYNKVNERGYSYNHILAPVGAAPLASSIIGNYKKTAIDVPNPKKTEIYGVSGEINVELAEGLALKSITAYRRGEYDLLNDTDGTELSAIVSRQSEFSKQFSQELNLTLNNDFVDGVLGVFYFNEDGGGDYATSAVGQFKARFVPVTNARSIAAFAQGVFHLTDRLSATAGIRYTRDRKKMDLVITRTSEAPANFGANLITPLNIVADDTYDAFTPKFGVDFQVTPTILLFASATRGYKSGGNSITALTRDAISFGPETIWSYEAGVKSDLLDRRLRVNVSAFQYDYKGLQVQQIIGPGNTSIQNAASARTRGLEIETTAKPFDGLTLQANYALLDAKYRSYPGALVAARLVPYVTGDPAYNAATGRYDASGNRLVAAPKQSFFAAAQYDLDVKGGSMFVRGEFARQSRTYYDPTNVEIMSQKPYSIVNAAVGFRGDDGWGLQFTAKNIGYTNYLIGYAANGLAPAGLAGEPRTFSVRATYDW